MCDPRKNALLKTASKSDRIDARKLAELLRSYLLRAVYHGEQGVGTLKELSRSYVAISGGLVRVKLTGLIHARGRLRQTKRPDHQVGICAYGAGNLILN